MARPFFNTVIEGVDGFVVTVAFRFTALRDAVLPPFTGRVLKHLLYTSECLRGLRRLYDSRRSFKPVRLSVLRQGSRRLFQTVETADRGPLRVRAGASMTGVVSAYTRGDPFSAVVDAAGCSGRLAAPLDSLAFEAIEARVEEASQLTAGIEAGRPFKLVIHTPLLIDTKVMSPPPLIGRRILKSRQAYRLLPTPAYIAAAATRLWLALVKGVTDLKAEAWIPYAVGRLSDILVAEIDYKIRPVTAIYGKDDNGKLRKPRGATGYIILEILKPRLAPILDKTLALAQHLGLGKSRSIGFGEIEVKPLNNTTPQTQ